MQCLAALQFTARVYSVAKIYIFNFSKFNDLRFKRPHVTGEYHIEERGSRLLGNGMPCLFALVLRTSECACILPQDLT